MLLVRLPNRSSWLGIFPSLDQTQTQGLDPFHQGRGPFHQDRHQGLLIFPKTRYSWRFNP